MSLLAHLLFLVLFVSSQCGVNAKYFPKLKDFAAGSNLRSSSTCGTTTSSKYCDATSLGPSITCTEKECKLSCCPTCTNSAPSRTDLQAPQNRRYDIFNGQPRPGQTDSSLGFDSTQNSKISVGRIGNIDHETKGFSISVWVNQTKDNTGTIFAKSYVDFVSVIYGIVISDYTITFYYIPKGSNVTESLQITPLSSQYPRNPYDWHFITVTVYRTEVSYFLDGQYVGTDTAMKDIINDKPGAITIGQTYSGAYKYDGLMQDIYFYSKALTNREITEAFTGQFPTIYVQSECRCPPSHPKISNRLPAKCAKNADKLERDVVSRLSQTSHPIEFVSDNDLSSYWLSEISDHVTIDIDLLYGQLQVFTIIQRFYGPQPEAMSIERSTDRGLTYRPWQYFAVDCNKTFGMVNNGALHEPDSVNCLKFVGSFLYNKYTATFRTHASRPYGSADCDEIYCSPKLLNFTKATNFRIHFYNHTHASTPQLAKYFGIYRMVISARCECFGNAGTARYLPGNATSNGSCICECNPLTNTEGTQCNRCKPLYNKKQFRRGGFQNSYPCVKCECHGHASRCYYNETLDASPSDRNQGDGGVCVDCLHHTTGRYCDVCDDGYYRDHSKTLDDPDVCISCGCGGPGVKVGNTDCTKDNSSAVAGQCYCKDNVTGRLCDQCKPGYYDLKSSHVTGCRSCDCDTLGTVSGNITCDVTTGQCLCKAHVTGQRCDQCKSTFYDLDMNNVNGCDSCACNMTGSTSRECANPGGQCSCKTSIEGRQCERCKVGSHSLSAAGCKACQCSAQGTPAAALNRCDPLTGKCQCKAYVTGFSCDRCMPGYYNLRQADTRGCTECPCDSRGTVGNTKQCDVTDGSCECKSNVTGASCHQCPAGFFNLSSSNPHGCQPCGCFEKGTKDGDTKLQENLDCDSTTGKCTCLLNVQGTKCDECAVGYVWDLTGSGCIACNCDKDGSKSMTCNATGHCDCKEGTGVGGQFCAQCLLGYHSFNKGSCTKCNCNAAGSETEQCDAHGCLQCKRNVQGNLCDTCKPGTILLKQENLFGCSGVPSQQGPPTILPLSPTILRLTWDPPDNPNGLITSYEIYRNDTRAYSGLARAFNDTGLRPYTVYAYHLVTRTDGGETRSLGGDTLYRTPEDAPADLPAPVITSVLSRSAKATWFKPRTANGIISEYILQSTNDRTSVTEMHYRGISLTYSLTNLRPFTNYNFSVVACTAVGCSTSDVTRKLTRSAAPESQPAPMVVPLPGGTRFSVAWDEPAQPNGIIHRYELRQRNPPFRPDDPGSQVFAFNPSVNPAQPRNVTVDKLQPFSLYEYHVITSTAQLNGNTASNWTRQRTTEAAPEGEHTIKPQSKAISSTAINISWHLPSAPNGLISRSDIYIYINDTSSSLALTVNGGSRGVVSGLQPYSVYGFTVVSCNSVACTKQSAKTQSRTLASAPTGQDVPEGEPLNSTHLTLTWEPPVEPNGPTPVGYHVRRSYAAFHHPPINAMTGVHFPGFGYYRLNKDTIKGGQMTDIELEFKTQFKDGLLLFLESSDGQDFLAVELRQGMPYFIFDCGGGFAVVAVQSSPTLNDKKWHHLKVTRSKKDGEISVDGGLYTGRGQSPVGWTVIGTNTGVYVGGVDGGLVLSDRIRNAVPSIKNGNNFAGCLRNVRLQKTAVVFQNAEAKVRVDPLSSGCPVNIDRGVYLKGGGYFSLKRGVFKGDEHAGYTLAFDLKTHYTSGLVLFTYRETPSSEYLAVVLRSRDTMQIFYKTSRSHGNITVTPKQPLCDGRWHHIEFTNFGAARFVLDIDGNLEAYVNPIKILKVSSELFFGGVPALSPAAANLAQMGIQITPLFGGCIRNIRTSRAVDLLDDVASIRNADLSGCPNNVSVDNEDSCRNANSTLVYAGQNEMMVDGPLKSFTDYLYQVQSIQAGTKGSGNSPWFAVRSGEGAPEHQSAPNVQALIGGKSLRAWWNPPAIYNGILRGYVLRAYNLANTSLNPVKMTLDDVIVLNATLGGLAPYTQYDVTVAAFTDGGSGESPGTRVTTLESVPESVLSPQAHRFPYHLSIFWRQPLKPNGVITNYTLTVNGREVYRGLEQTFNLTGLQVYTPHDLQLTACTSIGCAKSPVVRLYTAELPPQGVLPPDVVILDSHSAEVRWTEPGTINGVLTGYQVAWAMRDGPDADVIQLRDVTAVVSTVTLRNLTAGTWYNFYVIAVNGGGATRSLPTSRRTVESSPEKIPPPEVRGLTPYSILATIREPGLPNGNITRYELYEVVGRNENLVLNGSLKNFTKTGLTPYTPYRFRSRVCTVKGCGSSEVGVGYTLEALPNGTVSLNVTILNATTVLAKWSTIHTPNGVISYRFVVSGVFLVPGTSSFETENSTRVVASVTHPRDEIVYSSLLPYTTFQFQINASNTVGSILSNVVVEKTGEGAPLGLSPPNVTVLNSTSAHVTWSAPGRDNGVLQYYQIRRVHLPNNVSVVVDSGLRMDLVMTDLVPYTTYQFEVAAATRGGKAWSDATIAITHEDVPESIDPPSFPTGSVDSRSLVVVWEAPDTPNGVIIHYILYRNNSNRLMVASNVTRITVTGLEPFTVYTFVVGVCTVMGCRNSSQSLPVWTLEDVPEGQSPPMLSHAEGPSVFIRWSAPSITNGKISEYRIQRRPADTSTISLVANVPANLSTEYQDDSVRPCTKYEYRVIAYTKRGGGTPSSWSNITVLEGAPDVVPTPTTRALNFSAIHVTWTTAQSQCLITSYVIRVLNNRRNYTGFAPLGPHRFTVGNLLPYTDYRIVVAACTSAACRDSSPSVAKTHVSLPRDQPAPTATPASAWSLNVKWDDPKVPAGRIVKFRLFRKTLDEPLSENGFTTPGYYVLIYDGSRHSFRDTGLAVFSAQQYKVMVVNTEGNITSNDSLPYRTGPGTPRAGVTLGGRALNHTSIFLNWTLPRLELLLGFVVSYEVHYKDLTTNIEYTFVSNLDGAATSVMVTHLKPSQDYSLKVVLNNGNGTFASNDINIRTLDGVPEGFDKPKVRTIDTTTIEVIWTAPRTPNGKITIYNIYTNGSKVASTSGLSLNLTSLISFTVYSIQVEVCTVYACVKSAPNFAKTLPAVPQFLDAPSLIPGRRNILVVWAPPRRPNGRMLEYRLFRRRLELCPTSPPPVKRCTYIECSLAEQLCGPKCYNPRTQICCNGVLYNKQSSKTCCDDKYLAKTSSSDVCCAGRFYPRLVNHVCCYGVYKPVKPGQVCCRDTAGAAIVGDGNACCAGEPYANNTKSCVCGTLYTDSIKRQCCGGKLTSLAQVCCGGTESDGRAYDYDSNKKCCGNDYVPRLNLCCKSALGKYKAYSSGDQCCGINKVDVGLSCCNDQGFNASTHVCADRATVASRAGCGTGAVCNKTSQTTAMCNRCDFDQNANICGFVPGYYTPVSPTPPLYDCGSEVVQIASGNGGLLSHNDQGLEPFTQYEYHVFARNTEGNVTSGTSKNATLMDAPEGLSAPIITVLSAHSIEIRFSPPTKPHGIISEYRVTRVDQGSNTSRSILVYNGTKLSFIDANLRPFMGYLYILEACTTVCSNGTSGKVAYTLEAAPENVYPPELKSLTPTNIQVRWRRPGSPNGLILHYVIRRINATNHIQAEWNSTSDSAMALIDTNLRPYTNYSYIVIACTRIGCTDSPRGFVVTLQAPPEGVSPPIAIARSSNSIEVNWEAPLIPNGVIVWYALYRDGGLIYNHTERVCPRAGCSFVDLGLRSHTWYSYAVEVSTQAGSTRSNATRHQTPESSPEGIPRPTLIPQSSTSIRVTWPAPDTPNGVILNYSVLVDARDKRVTQLQRDFLVTGLNPYTVYGFQVEACTVQGCGVGNRSYARTLEAAPQGQTAPTVVARSDAVVSITWTKPSVPNGVILRYEIERQLPPEAPVVVDVILASDSIWRKLISGLLPYRNYSFRIRAVNGAGSTRSPWTIVRTLEGAPSGVHAPVVIVLNATSVLASWQQPGVSNGHIIGYELWSRESIHPGNEILVATSIQPRQNVTIGGLKPNTDYEFRLAAKTARGTGYSQWVLAETLEAPPLGLGPLVATKHANGRELDLKWSKPSQPNGVITEYVVYSDGRIVCRGITRQCSLARLQPYTTYMFLLEACTSAGCTKGRSQNITTAEIAPLLLAAPSLSNTNTSAVLVQWKAPLQPNGRITMYQVWRTLVVDQSLLLSVFNTSNGSITFSYVDQNLRPFTTYGYKVQAINSAGSTDSPLATITTEQAPPEFIAPPVVTSRGSSSVDVSWQAPAKPNGKVISYTLRRNGTVVDQWNHPSVLPLSYQDTALDPATHYSYWIVVCTGGGCTQSAKASVKTGESRPGAVRAPTLTVRSAIAITIQWQPPIISNGIVLSYKIYQDGIKIAEYGRSLFSHTVSGLEPYKAYTFNVSACTRSGCTSGEPNTATTHEAAPEIFRSPTYVILGPSALEIKWAPPEKPNGLIIYYALKRNDTVVYNGTELRFNDLTVLPYSYYQYIVVAGNSRGRVESKPLYTNRTSAGTPENVTKPVLLALSGTQIRVSWTSPLKPNGVITEYIVLYGNIRVSVGVKQLFYVAENLRYYTWYSFRIQACTSNPPCAESPAASARTLEGPPLGLAAPQVTHVRHRSAFVTWRAPTSPNGIILRYVLERSAGGITVVFNGTLLQFNDTNLVPYTKYRYRVTGYNSRSSVTSAWGIEVTTDSWTPENVPLPEVSDITATSFKVTINTPEQPNGVITDYKVEANGRNVSSGLTTERTIDELEPYADYEIRVFACTVAGCTASQAVRTRTDSAPPGKVEAVTFGEVTATTIHVKWQAPLKLNGILSRYVVSYQSLCSDSCARKRAVTEHEVDVGLDTSYVIRNLQPYTKYRIVIQVENDKHIMDSDPVDKRTMAADPLYVRLPLANISGHVVVVDWSNSFQLNGPLIEFILFENEVMIFRGLSKNSGGLPDRGESEFIYVVSATTNVNGEQKTVRSVPLTVNIADPGGSRQSSDEDKTWYRQIWFIVLISVMAILAVFAVVALCLRKTSGDRDVYVRDRDPLPIRPKSRSTPMSLASNYTPSEAYFNMVEFPPDARSRMSDTFNGESEKVSRIDWEGYVPNNGPDYMEWPDVERSWSEYEEPQDESSTKYLVFPDTHL